MASMHMTGKVDLCGVHSLKFSPPVSPRFHGQLRVRGIIWPHSSAAAYCYRPSSYRTVVCPVCLSVTLVYCAQTVGWMKMTLGTEVGLGPGHTVLDGDRAPPKGETPNFRPMSVVAKRLDE